MIGSGAGVSYLNPVKAITGISDMKLRFGAFYNPQLAIPAYRLWI
jgi:hypothetical protein